MFAIVNYKNEIGTDKYDGAELQFESKGAAVLFMQFRTGDIELQGKPRVKELEVAE